MRIYDLGGYEIEDRRRRRSDGTYMGVRRGYMPPMSHHGMSERMREIERREAELDEREAMLEERSAGRVRRVGYESYPIDHLEGEGYYDYPEYRYPMRRYY